MYVCMWLTHLFSHTKIYCIYIYVHDSHPTYTHVWRADQLLVPCNRSVAAVIVDEFHERNVQVSRTTTLTD